MVDVRPLAAFKKGHASCAHRLHFETTPAFAAQDAKLEDNLHVLTNGDKKRPVVVYGESEARAGRVQNFLRLKHGYGHVTNAHDWATRSTEIEALCQCSNEDKTPDDKKAPNDIPYYAIPEANIHKLRLQIHINLYLY